MNCKLPHPSRPRLAVDLQTGEERMDLQARLLSQGRARAPACPQAQDQPARHPRSHRPGGCRGRSRWGRHDGWEISCGRQEVRGFPPVCRSTAVVRFGTMYDQHAPNWGVSGVCFSLLWRRGAILVALWDERKLKFWVDGNVTLLLPFW